MLQRSVIAAILSLMRSANTASDYFAAYVLQHWKGLQSLSRSFWINTVLPTLVFISALWHWDQVASFVGRHFSAGGVWVVTATVMLLWGAVLVWQVYGTWRSCDVPSNNVAFVVLVRTLLATYVLTFVPALLYMLVNLRSIDSSDFAAANLQISSGFDTVTVSGEIGYGAAAAMELTVNQNPRIKVVLLDSNGGILSESEAIADLIEERGFSTIIIGKCLSACTRVFAAGRQRIMLANSNIGFHSIRSLFSDPEFEKEAGAEFYLPMVSKGLPAEMIDRITATPAEEMWYAPTMPLHESGFITGIAADLPEARSLIDPGYLLRPVLGDNLSEGSNSTIADGHKLTIQSGTLRLNVRVPEGLHALTSEDPGFDVFDSMTAEGSQLMLALVRDQDLEQTTNGAGLLLFARVEVIHPESEIDGFIFGLMKNQMASEYQDLIEAARGRMQVELNKGTQRLSNTIRTDVQMQNVDFRPLRLVEEGEHHITFEFELTSEMLIEGESVHAEQHGLQSLAYINGAVIAINWYANKNPEFIKQNMVAYSKEFLESTFQLNQSVNP